MHKRKLVAVIIATLAIFGAGCAYEDVSQNEVGVKLRNGEFSGEVTPGRNNTTTWIWNTIKVVRWKSGVARAEFEAAAADGSGGDPIRVASLEGAQVTLDVEVSYRIDPAQTECLYKAGLVSDNAIHTRLIRRTVQEAFGSTSAYVTAKDIQTLRRGELADVVLQYLRYRFGQDEIPNRPENARPVTDPEQKIGQTHPQSQIRKASGCGIEVESVLVTNVTLPPQVQQQVDDAIQAEADARKAVIGQQQATAESETARIKAEAQARDVLIAAQAEAQGNRELAASLSPGLIELEIMKACAAAIEKTQASVASCGSVGSGGGSSNNIVIPAG